MIRLASLFWLVMTGMAMAAPVVVKSGEHDGFTRLVLEYQKPVDWQVGRTDDGYALRIASDTPSYDLTEAFKLIGKSRLAGISADTASGTLYLAIACACYAIPFEFRPGIVVIDLRDGAPPNGSSFELPLAASATNPNETPSEPTSRNTTAADYNWTLGALAQLRTGQREPVGDQPFTPQPSSDPALQPLRGSLLRQLSRGAAEGIVDIAKLSPSEAQQTPPSANSFDSVRLALGELPGISTSNGLSDHSDIGAQGQQCTPSARLDVANWGDDSPISIQIAASKMGLIAEFDKPDPEALQSAVRFQLFIGFGVEAKQLMRAFPDDFPDRALWRSMANLVDGRADPDSAFLGQEACDTAAALWAILAQPALQAGQHVNTDAAFLAFSALPIGLRRDLGPALADRFIAVGATDAAARVRDAILRAPGGESPDVAILAAKIEMHQGDAPAAEATLHQLVENPGPATAAALVALVEARITQDLPIASDMVAALEAIAKEQTGSVDAAAAIHALLLAKAASGDMDGAFAMLSNTPAAEPQLWRILSLLGTDDALLSHAVLPPSAPLPQLAPQSAAKLAERLARMGMADSALQWMGDGGDPILLAQIQLQRRDGRGALRALTGQDSPEALALRAQAMQQLGDDAAAAQIYAQTNDSVSEQRALGLAENWPEISRRGTDPWKQLAEKLAPVTKSETGPAAEEGPLAHGKRLVASSATTRTAIETLLAQVTGP